MSDKVQNLMRQPSSKKEEQEFGPGKKGFVMCPDCNAAYYNKSWHHGLEGAVRDQLPEEFADHDVTFETCPVCKMKKDGTYEGEVIIKLGKPAEEYKEEILKAIRNSDDQAQDRDVMDAVLKIDDRGSEIRVYTSENQLAVKIGKKLDSAFKGGRLEIKYSEGEDTARVIWEKFN
jgi:NMD protein affecting ribosome stability and mRNA decay